MAKFTPRYSSEVQQMMFVAGETQEIANETSVLVESIVRDQIINILTRANELAVRRGQRFITLPDIIFQIRHDTARLTRLQNILRWKKCRRDARKADDDAEDALSDSDGEDTSKKTGVALMPWDEEFMFSVRPPGGDADSIQINKETRERLTWADEVTRRMTADEYKKWCAYRKASFHRTKESRFREWGCIGVVADVKKKDDCIEILGSLAVEMVHRLTDNALSIQAQELTIQKGKDNDAMTALWSRKQGLFIMSHPTRSAIHTEHVRKVFETTQGKPKRLGYQLNAIVGHKQLGII
ncbi:transcription factor spt3 [Fusarium beomiforme]|uniref:Transcription factor spt3 n=1 Tax=Fusarium beomiforme TaxID=44412 RepID=A0A9P5DZY6_9HYPO|nr:transcription factor spt3 [Fusarium beomiforme]